MLPGSTIPPPPRGRLPALVSGTCVVLVPIAVACDAWGGRWIHHAGGMLWLDVAALAALAWALAQPGAIRDREAWRTPVDGLVMASLAVAAVRALPAQPGSLEVAWWRHVLACAGLFFGLSFVLRRFTAAIEVVWVTFAATAAALGLHAISAVLTGAPHLRAVIAAADARWAGEHVLARALLLATCAIAGRAFERGASPWWRLAVAVGAAGLALHAVVGGFGLGPAALARLDDPLYFSVISVTLLLAVAVAREAMRHRGAWRGRRWRWTLLGATCAGTGVLTLLGEGAGGEAVRALATLAAAAVVAAPRPEAGAEVLPLPDAQEPETMQRAA